ncbi:penicillin acylase family protein [Paraburkholderia flava]|uniref:penicillin acylase family protein n=1 Tax=Paraburkholderia flava TaxID=2547393 RepID=UPI00105E2993|nr:penicillin acylase family protein [Paraburkholderia flava]
MTPLFRRFSRLLSTVAVISVAVLPAAHAASPAASATPYRVDVRRTQDGIPHVEARDWGSLGYGYGYVQAQDNLCTLADAFLTWRGERSAWFGADARTPDAATFGQPRNLDADFFFRSIADDDAVARYRAAQPLQLRELVAGFADGYNRYVDEMKRGNFPGAHAECAGKPWVKPISSDDLYRRLVAVMLAGGGTRFLSQIAQAQPPRVPQAQSSSTSSLTDSATLAAMKPIDPDQLAVGGHVGIGSNAYVFGGSATRDGHSLLFGNPHWFWRGPDRFYQAQLTIPGQLDVAGVSFLAVPVIMIGFNHDIAWTHTVSSARRFGFFELKLVPGDPTRYVIDGHEEAMRPMPVTVQVRDMKTGQLTPVTRVLYRSRFGPMVDLSAMSPALGWNAKHAFALRDVNEDNTRAFANFLAWGKATSLDDFISIQKRYAALPWVNTLAIGRGDPRVWFADIGAVPNVPDTLAAACTTPAGHAFDQRVAGVPFLDGSRSACEWVGMNGKNADVARTAIPGAMPVTEMPSLLRRDYAGNFNGSYWLSNPQAPLTGFAQVQGETGTPQSLRTRLGHTLAQQLMSAPGGVARDALEQTVLSSGSMSERLFRQPLLDALCAPGQSAPTVAVAPPATSSAKGTPVARTVDLAEACRVLRAWDGTGNVDARGANLWDEFWARAQRIPAAKLYATPFDPSRPLATPAGLNTANPALVQALGAAVLALQDNGFALDSTRGTALYIGRDGAKIPLYGGCDLQGYFTSACTGEPLDRHGYSLNEHAHGNTYVQVVGFGADGPEADTLLSHSESDDPASPHSRDATLAYAQKAWARFPFTAQAIRSAPGMTETTLSGPRAIDAKP